MSRKQEKSIRDGVFEIFYWLIPSGSPGVDSACKRNEYQESFLGGKRGRRVELTNLPPSSADCLKILEVSIFWSRQKPFMLVQS
jgi:hypothetical protein